MKKAKDIGILPCAREGASGASKRLRSKGTTVVTNRDWKSQEGTMDLTASSIQIVEARTVILGIIPIKQVCGIITRDIT
jgi:hypothetical protein